MASVATLNWMRTRLAPRHNVYLGEISEVSEYENPGKREIIQYTNVSNKDLQTVNNPTENIIRKGHLVKRADGKLAEVVNDVLPGESGQAVFERNNDIVAGQEIMLSDNRVGRARSKIAPGETGELELEIGDTILAGTEVKIKDRVMGVVVTDILPGQKGQARWVKFKQAKVGPNCVLGVVRIEDELRQWYDYDFDALANMLEPGLPNPLPAEKLTEAQFNNLVVHAASVGDPILVESLGLWRGEGLI